MNQLRASDLRLGNLVLFRGKICKVTTLSGDIIRVSEPEVGIIEQAYAKSPIELTPEVLGWCGFEHMVLDSYENPFFAYKIGGLLVRKYDKTIMSVDIKYLHQLQNIIYSLLGEELTISLPTVKMEG